MVEKYDQEHGVMPTETGFIKMKDTDVTLRRKRIPRVFEDWNMGKLVN